VDRPADRLSACCASSAPISGRPDMLALRIEAWRMRCPGLRAPLLPAAIAYRHAWHRPCASDAVAFGKALQLRNRPIKRARLPLTSDSIVACP